MANSTSPVPQVVEGTGAVQKINDLNDANSQGLIGGRNAATSALLVFGYIGGRIGGINVANGTVTLTASNTNYVVMKKSDGVVSASTATTNWDNYVDYWRLYSVVTSSTTWTSYTDERSSEQGLFGIGAVAMTNPMTTAEDIIKGGVSGTAARVAVGANGQVLTVTAGVVGWANSAAGFANPMTTAGDIITGGVSGAAGRLSVGSNGQVLKVVAGAPAWAGATQCIPIACSDEFTALTTGAAKVTFRMPYAFTLTAVRASLTTAQASGSIFTVDINENGTTILSTKLTIDNTEKTSTTAATSAVISDTALADDAEITIDIDQVGASGASGLKVYLIGAP